MSQLYRLPARHIVRLRGKNARAYMHDTSTQDVAALSPGNGAFVAFITDKGKVRGFGRMFVLTEDDVVLDATDGRLDDVVGPYAPLAGVECNVEEWTGLRFAGDGEALKRVGLSAPEAPYAVVSAREAVCVRGGWGDEGWDVIGRDAGSLEEALLAEGAGLGDPLDLEEARIAAGRPRFGIDVTQENHINETPLLVHAVSFTKGCYPGQESVARVHNLGRVNRKLRVLDLEEMVSAGVEVSVDGGSARVTSVAREHALVWLPGGIEPGARVPGLGRVTAKGWT